MRTRKPGQGSVVPLKQDEERTNEPQPLRFLLLKGTYFEKGRKYTTGDYVESYREIDLLLPRKFRRITDPGVLSVPVPENRDTGFRLINKGIDIYDVVNTKTGETINTIPISLELARRLEQASGTPFREMPPELFALLHEYFQKRLEDTDSLKK